jgi:hypothetical protein
MIFFELVFCSYDYFFLLRGFVFVNKSTDNLWIKSGKNELKSLASIYAQIINRFFLELYMAYAQIYPQIYFHGARFSSQKDLCSLNTFLNFF